VTGLTKRYGQVPVLGGVDLDVQKGELLALVGENGVGKSTIVKCIAGVVTPDSGRLTRPAGRIAVVWQDLSLCDNLDTVANLFLGRERGRLLLSDESMHLEAHRLLARFDIRIDDIRRPVGMLSGGQRQAIALARATMDDPELLILDEPTASLGVTETQTVVRLIRQLRARGATILLVSHDIDQVFELADRIAILRQGRIVATLLPQEVHPDDVVAVMSGAEIESTARKQLQRLRSLVDQLSEAEPGASLPLIVSAMASALGREKLCVHLLEEGAGKGASLQLVAAVGLPPALIDAHRDLPLGIQGGPAGLAASTHEVVVVEDIRIDPLFTTLRPTATESGVLSAWAAPIVGTGGVIGTVSGYGDAVGRPADDQLELVSVYASHAAAAIERERLLNRSLQLAMERESLLVSQQEAAALRQSNAMQRQFLSRLSHELRTPLTAVQGYVSTLQQPDVTWDPDSQARFLDRISTESGRMVRLVGDLLDSSAIESGILRVNRAWCDVALVLEASISCLSLDAAQRVELQCDPSLGPIWADHDRLEQLFLNLLENAITHTPPGTLVGVTAQVGATGDTVVIRVVDDGPGIPSDLAQRMFRAHERGTTTAPGAGLGLTIAKGIVDAHGGRLEWQPLSGGTCFEVVLPVDPPVSAA
jgi:signal transduction histidine kinase/ABC-type multidrug transport system ATPase subunit